MISLCTHIARNKKIWDYFLPYGSGKSSNGHTAREKQDKDKFFAPTAISLLELVLFQKSYRAKNQS